jgi:tRNA (adenine22-N1)-methyltransferase
MKLTPRLQIIADSVRDCDTLADIGTDHAYLPIELIKKGKIKRAIAGDINKGPIEIARGRICANKLEGKIEARQGNGLAVLQPEEADTIVIAGMGGMLIAEIIQQSRQVAEAAKQLILQPMTDSGKLRSYLLEQGFEIFDEELAKEDRKLYEILWVRYTGKPKPMGGPLEIGPKVIDKNHPLALALIGKKEQELHGILDKLKATETESSQVRIGECKSLLEYYKEVRKCLI